MRWLRTVSLLFPAVALLWTNSAFAANASLTEMGLGVNAYGARDYRSAAEHLRAAGHIPKLADYVAYYLAASEQQLHDFDAAAAVLSAYRNEQIASSPLGGRISLLEARVLLDERQPSANEKALAVLERDQKILPQPDGDFALGLAYEALGEPQQSSLVYERVYYSAPNTELAADAWIAMERLRAALGKDFPAATAQQRLDRCEKWLEARQYKKAHDEYGKFAGELTGPEKDEAKVGIGVADYLGGDSALAFRDLKDLHLAHSETDAKRLYYLTEAAGKLSDDKAMTGAISELNEHYTASRWRQKALIAAGNRYLGSNNSEQSAPLYAAASKDFPSDAETAYAHWKTSWDAYLNVQTDRVRLLREQIERFPDDNHAGSALYYLGRIAEDDSEYAASRAYYDRLVLQFPHYFYGVLARDRMKQTGVVTATPDDSTKAWLDAVKWPEHRDFSDTEPNEATRARIERGRMLLDAGLADIGENEYRFGASLEGEQPHLLALDLAQAQPSPYKALRIMKSLSADYLAVPTDTASVRFWQMLFPLPWKAEVTRDAEAHGLDPYFVAALIRQESEFNPDAKSRANAYGLMQLIPSTGRMLGREQGTPVVRTGMLLNPVLNIQLGTRYLRAQLDAWNGNLYQTLAAYNAGPGRVKEWLSWMKVKDPVEFVENIPFRETREYVQAVLRNADMYREIYSGKRANEIVAMPDPAATSVSSAAPAAPARKRSPARNARKSTSTRKKHA